ncbi:MAG: electron transport complex subunit RsxC [Spirochaetes bacterium]|nr:electron transport complex subunit RsxC [Spirochaetota bacterium]
MNFKKSFGYRGAHPDDYKYITNRKSITFTDVPDRVYIPVIQHIGAPAKIIVSVGQVVEEGQLIAEANGFVSANIHSSIPGTVVAIEERYLSVGKKSQTIVVELNGEFRKSGKNIHLTDWKSMTKDQLLKKIKDYGIVGMGGATFPTHVKLTIPNGKNVDTLIVNGAECEPYITGDHRLMIDKSEDLLEGINIINKILDVPNIYIGIESNKKDAIKRLKTLCLNRYNIKIVPLKVKYPQGDEKQIIKAVTNRIVQVDQLPSDVGVIVQNIATVIAIKEAIVNDKPLIDRIVTISGSGIKEPKNLKVKIGTLLKEVIAECGGLKEDIKKVVIGGPMMGFAQYDLEVPVTKGCSAVVVLSEDDYTDFIPNGICLNCGKCINACAFGLAPTIINKYIKYNLFDKAADAGLLFCKECGACAWSCPARIPLVQNFRLGKDIYKKLAEKKKKNKG